MKKEKPILFKTEMIKKILVGKKTITRRIIKPQPGPAVEKLYHRPDGLFMPCHLKGPAGVGIGYPRECPYEKGMILWCRETWAAGYALSGQDGKGNRIDYIYRADKWTKKGYIGKWKPSIFMPREACRLFLEVLNVRAERLQDITLEDIIAEGINPSMTNDTEGQGEESIDRDWLFHEWMILWNSINAIPKPKFKNKIISHYESYPWSDDTRDQSTTINGKPHYCFPNPYVWRIEFKKIDNKGDN